MLRDGIARIFSRPGRPSAARSARRAGVRLGLLAALAPWVDAAASSWPERTVESLAVESDGVARARVVGLKCRRDGEDIVTDATFELVYPIEGDFGPTFQVVAVGGFLPEENLGLTVSDEPRFALGEDWTLFIARGDGAAKLVSGALGAFRVRGAMAVGEDLTAPLGDLYDRIAQGAAKSNRALTLPQNWRDMEDKLAAETPAAEKSYVLTGTRWPGASPIHVPVRVNSNSRRIGAFGTAQQFASAVMDGAYGWNAAPNSDFEFDYAGGTAATTTARNNLNEVMFEYWTVTTSSYPPLAQTRRWFDGNNFLLEVDTRINDYYYCVPLPPVVSGVAFDLTTLTLHEFGHWLSLSHDASPTAVMSATQDAWSVRRMLGADDIQGIGALYPNGYVAAAPTNDARSKAVEICVGEIYGYLARSTADGGAMSCLGITPPNDVWFQYCPAYDGNVSVGTCGSGVPNFIQIYIEKADGSLLPSFCGAPCAFNHDMSQAAFRGCGGLNYIIRMAGRADAPEGLFHIELDGPPCAGAPANAVPQIKNMIVGKAIVGPFTPEILDVDGNGTVDVGDLTKATVAQTK